MTDPGRLASIRRVDWRFLLPADSLGTVAVVGPADEALLAGLRAVARHVTAPGRDGPSAEVPAADLVVTIAASRSVLDDALGRVSAGGWVYVGAGPRRSSGRASLRHVAAALRAAGFVDVRRSWHWPSEPSALEIVPMDHTGAVRLVLDRRRSGRAARLKAMLAAIAHRLGVLDRIVPGWSVIGRRPGGEAGRSGQSRLDPVRASVPAGGGAEAGVILLTPRFKASRHVIGLLVRPVGAGLEAVAKLPRLPGDDGGIQREGAALQRAAELGVTGVPAVIALRGAPGPVLVETALDGVVIASREVRAQPATAIAEVEAWTRALAGHPDRRQVPLRALWAAALERIAAEPRTGTDHVDGLAIATLAQRTAALLRPFDDVEVPAVLEHGDLAPPNLLRLRDGRLGVVDWEVADLEGLPLGDLLFFVAFAGDDDAARPALERQAAHLGIDAALIPALRLAMWARWADRQLARFLDGGIPLGERLPARHVRSWAAAVTDLEVPG